MGKKLVHFFERDLLGLIKELQDVLDCGYDGMQVGPLQPCKEGDGWYFLYQPLGMSIGNKCGTKEDLVLLCDAAKEMGLIVVVDIVLRHCANQDGDEGKNTPHDTVCKKLKDNPEYWTCTPNITNFDDRYQVVHSSFCLPMLDYDNKKLQDIYISFIQELVDCGVGGLRIDMGKHFAMKSEGSDFWPRVIGPFSHLFNYAECLGHDRGLIDEYAKFIRVIGDINTTNEEMTVAYVMSHDTELNLPSLTAHMTDEIIIREWGYLLQNKRINVLFFARIDAETRIPSDLWKSDAIKKINKGESI